MSLPVVYALIAGIEVLAEGIGPMALVFVTKPLLMPVLFVWAWASTRSGRSRGDVALLVSLVGSWLGDVFLMLPGDRFVAGLGSFLFAHAAYLVAFLDRPRRTAVRMRLPFFLTVGLLAYGASMLWVLWPRLGDLAAPVCVYMGVILSMGIAAFFRHGAVSSDSFRSVAAGATLFILSDSLIAWSRFVGPIPLHRVVIMATYAAGQYGIVRGLLAARTEAHRG